MEKKNITLESGGFDKRIPLALVATLLLQCATAVWWASAKDRDDFFLEQRVNSLESSFMRSNDVQSMVLQRLALLEERVGNANATLDRIEKKLNNR